MNNDTKTRILAPLLSLICPLATAATDIQDNPAPSNTGDWATSHSLDNLNNHWGAGISISTLGLGGHVTYQFNKKFYLKGEIQGLTFDKELDLDNINYDSKLDFFSSGITANYLPFANSTLGKGFRISFGGYAVDNNISIDASAPGQVLNIGNIISYTFQAGDSLTGDISYSDFAPYLGIGWDWAWGNEKQYIVSFDAGAIFIGPPEVNLTPNSALLGSVPQIAFNSEEQDIIDDLEKYDIYPVVKLGFTWRF